MNYSGSVCRGLVDEYFVQPSMRDLVVRAMGGPEPADLGVEWWLNLSASEDASGTAAAAKAYV